MVTLQLMTSGCSEIREYQIRSMTDPAKLAAIAMDPKEVESFRTLAIEKITDQKVLAEIAESPNMTRLMRADAVRKLDDQAVLARVATSSDKDSWVWVQTEAVQRLTDEQALADIATSERGDVAFAAVSRLWDQPSLARVAIEAPSKEGKETYEAPSTPVFKTYSDGQWRSTTIIMSNKTEVRVRDWHGFKVNERAVAKLTGRTLLARVKAESKEPGVRASVDRRLAELPLEQSYGGTNTMVLMSTSMGDIKIELYAEKAPDTVKNFLGYVTDKFYDGTIFDSVTPNFSIMGGAFDKDMNKKPTKPPITNEAGSALENDSGTLAMGRHYDVVDSDTARFTARFVINVCDHKDDLHGERSWSVFGKVVDGMDVVRKIEQVPTEKKGDGRVRPSEPVIIKSVTVVR